MAEQFLFAQGWDKYHDRYIAVRSSRADRICFGSLLWGSAGPRKKNLTEPGHDAFTAVVPLRGQT